VKVIFKLAMVLVLVASRWTGVALDIDDFNKGQGFLIQTTAGSSFTTRTGPMLGGERDLKVTLNSGPLIVADVQNGTYIFNQDAGAVGSAEIVWDGTDGNGNTIATTGLSPAVDLMAGGSDAFLLGVISCNQSVNVRLIVYSTAGPSTNTFTVPPVAVPPGTPNYIRIEYSAFTGGGNFTAVGAIQLTVISSPGAELVIDFLRTTSTSFTPPLEATMTDVILVDNDGNGRASPGDTLRYIVTIKNNSPFPMNNVSFAAFKPANTTLVAAFPLARHDGPATDPAYTGAQGNTLNVSAPGLLDNDFLGLPAASPATITSFGVGVTDHPAGSPASVSGHTLTVNSDGSLTFQPSTGFTGPFTFLYRMTNGSGSSDASVTLQINGL